MIQLVHSTKHQYDVTLNDLITIKEGICYLALTLNDTDHQFINRNRELPDKINGIDLQYATFVDMGNPLDFTDETPDEMVDRLIPDDNMYHIPHKFNNSDRTFELLKTSDNEDVISWKETTKINFYKFHMALLGNPDVVLFIKLDKTHYFKSDYYKQLVANRHNEVSA